MVTANMKITQATFDETVLENEDIFELNPDEAAIETVSQFRQQGIIDLEKFVVTSHPQSAQGRYERQLRTQFEEWMRTLDQSIADDGSLISVTSDVCEALTGIRNFCSGRFPDLTNESLVDKANRHIPFLSLFQTSGSIFTLMSLFTGTVDTKAMLHFPDEYHQSVWKETVLTLISILSCRSDANREISTSLKDQFSAFDQLLCLISYYDTLKSSNEYSGSRQVTYIQLLTDLIALSSVLCRNIERNKVTFVRTRPASLNQLPSASKLGGIQILVMALRSTFLSLTSVSNELATTQPLDTISKELIRLLSELCNLVSVLCRFDDFRTDAPGRMDSSYGSNMSSVHDHVLELFHEGAVPIFCDIAHFVFSHIERAIPNNQYHYMRLAASVLTTNRVIAVNDDVVQALVATGSLKIVQQGLNLVLTQRKENEENDDQHIIQITSATLGLIRNLCGNDEIKTTLCLGSVADPSSSVLLPMFEAMALNRMNATIQEHACGSLAAMALRKPENALKIIEKGGPKQIVTAMRQHPNHVLVQRQAALAIRNIVSRLVRKDSSDETECNSDNHVRDVFLELGTESVLREITASHQGSIDEAYAALRDLGCNVSMLTYDAEKNAMVNRTIMFGEIKPQFRPTYDN